MGGKEGIVASLDTGWKERCVESSELGSISGRFQRPKVVMDILEERNMRRERVGSGAKGGRTSGNEGSWSWKD